MRAAISIYLDVNFTLEKMDGVVDEEADELLTEAGTDSEVEGGDKDNEEEAEAAEDEVLTEVGTDSEVDEETDEGGEESCWEEFEDDDADAETDESDSDAAAHRAARREGLTLVRRSRNVSSSRFSSRFMT